MEVSKCHHIKHNANNYWNEHDYTYFWRIYWNY